MAGMFHPRLGDEEEVFQITWIFGQGRNQVEAVGTQTLGGIAQGQGLDGYLGLHDDEKLLPENEFFVYLYRNGGDLGVTKQGRVCKK
jgi:hypothetical protein